MTPIKQTRMQKIVRKIIHFFCRANIFILSRHEITGREYIPEHGPMLVVANHISMADQYFIAVNVTRRMMYMAKEELFRVHPISLVVQAFGAFPVRRGGMDRKALEQARRVLESGLALFVFPEGTRSKNAKLQRGYTGSASIAMESHVPILPVAVTGLENVKKGPLWWVFHRHQLTVTITFGKPFHLPEAREPSKTYLYEMSDYIMEHIAELLPPDYRGYYADKVESHDAKD